GSNRFAHENQGVTPLAIDGRPLGAEDNRRPHSGLIPPGEVSCPRPPGPYPRCCSCPWPRGRPAPRLPPTATSPSRPAPSSSSTAPPATAATSPAPACPCSTTRR